MIKNKTFYYLFFFFLIANIYLVVLLYKSNHHKDKQFLPDSEAVKSIRLVLDKQVSEWNEGNIPGFMDGYVASESLIFMTSKTTLKGKQNLEDLYLKNFDSREKRGKLNFIVEEYIPLDNLHHVYLVPGRWEVARIDTLLQGKFSLVFKKHADEGWKIIADHTW